SSASATTSSSRGSAKKSRQPMSATVGAEPVSAALAPAATGVISGIGHVAGIPAWAAGVAGTSVAQPLADSARASASARRAGLVMFDGSGGGRLGGGLGAPASGQLLDDDEEQRDEEHAQQGAHHHAADHAGTDGALRTRTRAG